jgi:MOB kinase activator 1
MMQQ